MMDGTLGVSIRFVQQWTPRSEPMVFTAHDRVLALVMTDYRDIPIAKKLADAWGFVSQELA